MDSDEEIKPISAIVSDEAQRILSEASFQADPALVAEGWERRFIAGGERVQEAIDLYTELGFEVRVENLREGELPESCEGCQLLMLTQFKTIYTRAQEEQDRASPSI
jgi:hypothetical protein